MNIDMAKRLVDRRRAAGLSQEGLAERLGVTRQAVSKWERSESSPDTDNLIALAKLYGVSLDDLLYADVTESDADQRDRSEEDDARSVEDDPWAQPDAARPAQSKAAQPTEDEAVAVEAVPIENEGGRAAVGSTDEAETSSPNDPSDAFHIGFDGIHVEDGKDHVHISWREGVHVIDHGGDEVHVGWDGVHINDKDYSSVYEAQCAFRDEKGPWNDSSAAVLSPERKKLWRTLKTFPFPLFVIIAYILLGCFQGAWLIGLELFLLIPLYYVTVALIMSHRVCVFFSAVYPLAVIGWFFYMAFALNEPHPAWVAFLTIPLAEWFFVAFSHWWHRVRRER